MQNMLVLISDARFKKFFFPLKTEVHLGGSLSGHQLLQMSCWLLVTALYVVFNSNVSQLLFRFLCYHQLNRSLGLSREKQMEASFRKRNSRTENPLLWVLPELGRGGVGGGSSLWWW